MEKTINEMMEDYFSLKDIPKRNALLMKITFQCPDDSKEFFFKAFKKERYLDMKLTALRGYSNYASEDEVAILTKKLLELLKKIPQHTPYAYEEYEIMRSAFLLPYLIDKYHYDCFYELKEQLDKQYNDLPSCFKGIFSCDENGNAYSIRDTEEVKKSIDEFFKNKST